jgi:hypothetical protein
MTHVPPQPLGVLVHTKKPEARRAGGEGLRLEAFAPVPDEDG